MKPEKMYQAVMQNNDLGFTIHPDYKDPEERIMQSIWRYVLKVVHAILRAGN